MSKLILERLQAAFGDDIVEVSSFRGDDVAVVKPSRWVDACKFVRDDPRCDCGHFTDLSAIDHCDPRTDDLDMADRFEVYVIAYSIAKKHRVRLKVRLPGDEPRIATLVGVWAGANWMEREVYDMFGVRFEGHPDERRILTYPEFKGHPLRKDYPANLAQPLLEYREGTFNKLGPFLQDEGMPLNRSPRSDDRN